MTARRDDKVECYRHEGVRFWGRGKQENRQRRGSLDSIGLLCCDTQIAILLKEGLNAYRHPDSTVRWGSDDLPWRREGKWGKTVEMHVPIPIATDPSHAMVQMVQKVCESERCTEIANSRWSMYDQHKPCRNRAGGTCWTPAAPCFSPCDGPSGLTAKGKNLMRRSACRCPKANRQRVSSRRSVNGPQRGGHGVARCLGRYSVL